MRTCLWGLLSLALLPATATGQIITNPTAAVWDHVDFATAVRYDLGYFLLPVKADNTCDTAAAPAASPVLTDNLGKPVTTTGLGLTAPLVGKPIGCYVARMRALDASGLFSDWSLVSNPFLKRPATPGLPAIK
jgi:hypothetical protein